MNTPVPTAAWVSIAVAVAVSVTSALVAGWFLVRLPADHFVRGPTEEPKGPQLRQRIAGVGLVLGGLVMSVPGIPGQGLLSVLLGLILLDIPWLRPLELRLMRVAVVRRVMDKLRARAGQPPMEMPEGG